jgi:trans-2,3-dihydro-3-hydroxyanthranilate isomerase
MARQCAIVDVFAERTYSGNQLAVVWADGSETTEELQRLAVEFGFSETVFIEPDRPNPGGATYAVRIFTPASELPFAGHPTLGAAWAIRNLGDRDPSAEIELREGVGPIRVWFEGDQPDGLVWMQQNSPEFGNSYPVDRTAAALGLEAADIDAGTPVQHVSTGIPFVIVPLVSLDAVRRARAFVEPAKDLFNGLEPTPLLVYARGAEEAGHHLRARMFAAQYGVPEDPATGSANGCLAAYLVQHNVLGPGPVRVAVEQGYEMGRPSVLYLDAERGAGADSPISVRVGGRVKLVLTGELA